MERIRELVAAMHEKGLELGYSDEDDNGIPDFFEHYELGQNDCSTVSAQAIHILRELDADDDRFSFAPTGPCQLRGHGSDEYDRHATVFCFGYGIIELTPSNEGARDGTTPYYNFEGNILIAYDQGIIDRGEETDPAYVPTKKYVSHFNHFYEVEPINNEDGVTVDVEFIMESISELEIERGTVPKGGWYHSGSSN